MKREPLGWAPRRDKHTADKHTGVFWEHTRPGRWPWVVGAVAVLALALMHGTLTRAHVQHDLTTRARAVLDSAGADTVTVEFVGRDGTLRGESPAEISEDALVMRVAAVPGARTVSFAATDNGAD